MTVLLAALPQKLEWLQLQVGENTQIGDKCIAAFTQAMSENLSVLVLHLDSAETAVTDKGMKALAKALPQGLGRLSLHLNRCTAVTDAGLGRLLGALPPTLSILDLGLSMNDNVSSHALIQLARSMPPKLLVLQLDLGYNRKISDSCLGAICSALPVCIERLEVTVLDSIYNGVHEFCAAFLGKSAVIPMGSSALGNSDLGQSILSPRTPRQRKQVRQSQGEQLALTLPVEMSQEVAHMSQIGLAFEAQSVRSSFGYSPRDITAGSMTPKFTIPKLRFPVLTGLPTPGSSSRSPKRSPGGSSHPTQPATARAGAVTKQPQSARQSQSARPGSSTTHHSS
mmetsp:Transcript_116142/g.266579  ORF Transcript_116142/g.266579 Transcript_116142/m.266579 type:complete len:339 (-) Transcript_116142:234-1250(-)